jgi:predicted transcriptional regulator
MARPASRQPTDGELEILQLLWESGPAELKQIHATLHEHRKVASTTVATMLGVMLGKGLVERHQGARGYRWSARVSRDAAARGLLTKLVDRLFDGSSQRLVAHLVEDGKLSPEECREIQALLVAQTSKDRSQTPSKRRGGQP